MTMLKNARGFTLIELLISMVILGVVLTGVVRMFSNTGHYHSAQEMLVDLSQDLRAVKQMMVQELREAGCDPLNKGTFGFQSDANDKYNTDKNSIHFTRDIDNDDGDSFLEPDGEVGTNEDICYYRTNDECDGAGALLNAGDSAAGCLRRKVGASGSGQPVMRGVTQFELQYWRYDSAQNKEIPMIPPFTKGQLEDVNTVQVIIEAQVENPDKVSGDGKQQLDFRVLIRNG